MRLRNARLCLDCEDVHDQQHCPICGSESFAFLTRWVTPSDTQTAESTPRATRPPDPIDRRESEQRDQRDQIDQHEREQVDVYRQILNPTPAPPRRGRLVARGAMGLALLGLARMIWRAAPEPRAEANPESKTGSTPKAGPEAGKDAR